MNSLFTSFESIIPIILIIVLGFVLDKKSWFVKDFDKTISKLIMNIGLPASIFVAVLKYLTLEKLIQISSGLIYTFGSIAIGYAIAILLVKILKVKKGRRGTFINTIVNANTIFIGLPLNIALFGNESLAYFLVYYITNTVSTWAIGIFFYSGDSIHEENKRKEKFNWKKLLPAPLVGFLVSLVFLVFKIPVASFATSTLTYVGNIVTPLSLIYIGMILSSAGKESVFIDKDTVFAVVGRFIFSPIVMVCLITLFGKSGGLVELEQKTFIIQSAAPALAVLPILTTQADGDVKYATNVVTITTTLFVIVVPILMALI